MTQRALPRPGEFYRHFKNRLYQIVAVAYQADDEAPVVVYQAPLWGISGSGCARWKNS